MKFFKDTGSYYYKIFLIFGILNCLMFSLLMPVANVPDEFTHYERMFRAFGTLDLYYDINAEFANNTNTTGIIRNYSEKIDKQTYFEYGVKPFKAEYSLADIRPAKEGIRYLPAALFFYMGYFLHLPILVCLQLAELGSIVYFILMGLLILKLMPDKKEVMCFILLMPMTIQQCASINYDAVMIPLCLLLVAYFFYCNYTLEKVGWKNIIIAGLLSIIIFLIKPPYILMAVIFLLIPFEKIDLKIGKHKISEKFLKYSLIIAVPVILVAAAVVMYLMRNNYSIKILYTCVVHPFETIRLLYNSFIELDELYFGSIIGSFGWLDTGVSIVYKLLFAVMFMYVCFVKENKFLSRKFEKPVFYILFIFIIVILHVALISHSLRILEYDLDVTVDQFLVYFKELYKIDGVQGRYFIPILPLIMLSVNTDKLKVEDSKFELRQFIFYTGSLIYCFIILYHRYWGYFFLQS